MNNYTKALVQDDCTGWMTDREARKSELQEIEEQEQLAKKDLEKKPTIAVFKSRK